MPLIPLDIPPGVMSNGTDLEAQGRWRSANLVRWLDGSLRPVGGWRARTEDVTANPCRSMHSWQDNSGNRWIAFGSSTELFVSSASGTLTDITPAGLTAGIADAALNTGFGGGFFGTGPFGTTRPDVGTYSEATTWSLDNFGERLVACSVADGDLLEWDLNVANNATTISGAPTSNLGLMVTEERFLFALGAGGDPRKVQWSDREDSTTWTAAATNEAGDFRLQTSGQIMAGIRTRGQSLILTDIDAHTATYIGPPFVYSFQRVGTACGLASRNAVAETDGGVFWMGINGFFTFNGSSVNELPCSVSDYVFEDINLSQISKAWAIPLGEYGEVWWFYPSASSLEVDRYVYLDYKEGHWGTGQLARTAGVKRGVFRFPLMTDATSDLYEHEYGLIATPSDIFAETGPILIGAGDQVMKCNSLIPDEQTQGDVTATFKTRFYPNSEETTHGPYSLEGPTDVRFTGRQVRMRVTGNTLSDWRVGVMRIEAIPGGRR